AAPVAPSGRADEPPGRPLEGRARKRAGQLPGRGAVRLARSLLAGSGRHEDRGAAAGRDGAVPGRLEPVPGGAGRARGGAGSGGLASPPAPSSDPQGPLLLTASSLSPPSADRRPAHSRCAGRAAVLTSGGPGSCIGGQRGTVARVEGVMS